MKKRVFILFFVGLTSFLFAQQSPVYSQYFVNELAYNPAVAGSKSFNPFVIITRQQWLGFQGAPLTVNISYHGALNNRSAMGGSLYHDQTGQAGSSVFELDYAYHVPLDKDRVNIAFGIGAKAIYYTLDLEAGNLPPGEDPAFSANAYNRFLADARSGLYLYGQNFYAGYSVLNMAQSNFNKEVGDGFSKNYLHRNYIGMLGYRHEYNSDIHFEPSVLIRKTESTKSQYDFSTRVFFQDAFWTGLSVRTNGSISAVIGFRAGEMHITYAYDHFFNAINAYQNGTHELSISFKFPSILSQRHVSFWTY
jgi:type IX secretion system PorP/SprF family membrane protein